MAEDYLLTAMQQQ